MKHRIKKGECVVTHTDEERKALGFETNLGGAELYCTSTALLKFDDFMETELREISYADFMARENTSDFNEASELHEAGKKLTNEPFDIDSYVPKGDIEGFPVEVVKWMLREQEAQGNKRDVSVFELDRQFGYTSGGFTWGKAKELDEADARNIIGFRNFGLFFEKYPKSTDTSGVVMGAKPATKQVIEVDFSEVETAAELHEEGKKLLTEARKAMGVPKEQSYNTTGAPTENFLLASLRADVKRMLEIAEAKNHDYGGKDSNPFANFMAVEHLGAASAEAGITVRMTDKLSRIITLLNKEAKVSDESITDTLIDLANYALILKALIAYKKQSVGTAVH